MIKKIPNKINIIALDKNTRGGVRLVTAGKVDKSSLNNPMYKQVLDEEARRGLEPPVAAADNSTPRPAPNNSGHAEDNATKQTPKKSTDSQKQNPNKKQPNAPIYARSNL